MGLAEGETFDNGRNRPKQPRTFDFSPELRVSRALFGFLSSMMPAAKLTLDIATTHSHEVVRISGHPQSRYIYSVHLSSVQITEGTKNLDAPTLKYLNK